MRAMRYLLVDCHSVIFAWPELVKLHRRRMSLAREELVKLLTAYQDSSAVRVVAVFDGQGQKFSEETLPGGIQVFYSASGQTADAIIERLVAKYGQEHEMTVVSNDNMERQTAVTFGASTLPAEALRGVLEEARREYEGELRKVRRK